MYLLLDRWQEFPTEKRRGIEKRIVGGRERYEGESDDIYERRKLIQSAKILGWLKSKECELSSDAEALLTSYREIYPDWRSELEEDEDNDGEERAGWVTIDSDPSVLLNVPPSQVIPLARKHTTASHSEHIDHKPFVGLIKERPVRAVTSLTIAAKKCDYPLDFWQSALEDWPVEASSRLTWLFGSRLAGLPSEIVVKLRLFAFPWLEKHFPALAEQDRTRSLRIFDELLEKLFEGGKIATESGIGNVRVAEDGQGWSRRTMKHAFNSASGRAALMLLGLLKSQNTEEESGIPSEVKLRLKRLVRAPGEGADHVIWVLAERLKWLHYLDPEWTRVTIVPWFDPRHPNSEPAWNGLLYGSGLQRPKLFSLLRTHFLDVFDYAKGWKWDDEMLRELHEILVCGCLWREQDEIYLTFPEVRLALQKTSDSGRSYAVEYLSHLIEKNHASWDTFGKPFLEKAWPKETRFQTEDTAITLSQIAGVSGDFFPEAVQTILPRLVPIYGGSGFLYRAVSRGITEEFELATRFPETTLALVNKLVPNNPPERLSNLDLILDKIAEAKPTLRQDRRWRRLKKIARVE